MQHFQEFVIIMVLLCSSDISYGSIAQKQQYDGVNNENLLSMDLPDVQEVIVGGKNSTSNLRTRLNLKKDNSAPSLARPTKPEVVADTNHHKHQYQVQDQRRILAAATTKVKVVFTEAKTPPTASMDKCQGDCDSGTCKPGLACMFRRANEPVPGCSGITSKHDGIDICYDPNPTTSKPVSTTLTTDSISVTTPTIPTKNIAMSKNYPLDQCFGDCKNDNDCKNELMCYIREQDGAVPGCKGTGLKGVNICIKPTDNPTLYNYDKPFRLKMFWRQGYLWQDEDFERKWCLQCDGTQCSKGDKMRLGSCDTVNERFEFIREKGTGTTDVRIRIANTDYCIEVRSPDELDAYVDDCDASNQGQYFSAGIGDFYNKPEFELLPRLLKGAGCLTVDHHPKTNELVYADRCDLPRLDNTSLWNRYS